MFDKIVKQDRELYFNMDDKTIESYFHSKLVNCIDVVPYWKLLNNLEDSEREKFERFVRSKTHNEGFTASFELLDKDYERQLMLVMMMQYYFAT